ncbi:MAG: hypothetical protein IKC64_01640, partial [Clostridia bacterium]|nr:hypothetical protein [Clostridia bacterium]
QAYLSFSVDSALPVFIRLLDNGDLAVLMLNNTDHWARARFSGESVGLSRITQTKLVARDLWTGEEFEIKNRVLLQPLNAHECRFLRVKVVKTDEKLR